MKLIVDDSTLRHVGCHGLHVRYIGWGVATKLWLFKKFYMGATRGHQQMVGWAWIVGPWHIFWRSKDLLRREGYSWDHPQTIRPIPPMPARSSR